MIGKQQMRKAVLLSLFFLTMIIHISIPIQAEESRIRLDMDSLNLELGTSTNMTLTLEHINGGTLKGIEGIENFEILSRGQSSNTSIINGKTTQSIQVNYALMPKTVGDFELIGYVEYEGKTYETNVLKVHVTEQSGNLDGETEEIFIKTNLSKENAYFGEKLVLTYELYSRYRIDDYGFSDTVQLDGFITKDFSKEQLKSNFVTIDGEKYIKYEVKKTILSPTTTGVMKIPSYKFQVLLSTGDFFSQGKSMYLSTEEQEINVSPLPTVQQPNNFTGLVGQLDVQATYSQDEVEFGQSLSLHVTLSGNSNLELVDALCPKDMENFTVYETEKDIKEDIIGNTYEAEKEFQVILVPKTTGELTIDPIHINYFDVSTGTYQDAEIPGKTITVRGNMPTESSQTGNSSNTGTIERNQIVINQINPVQQNDVYFILKKSHVYIALLIILLLIIILAIIFYIRLRQRKQDKPLKDIYSRMKKAKDNKDYYDILNEMIKYRYHVSIKASSQDEIRKQILNHTVVEHTLNIMNTIENSYKQEGKSGIQMKEMIKKIYKEIK